ncbi:hypothetical protein SAICODRAFT_6746 [Saitoella complicata NRRL Y-17804]|nr:uncharacterized protein SAICODRAFT_6746 [Saitoella complicata NRRL Y-17804]ODQ53965.1 hypothetical protein SAICODRAFT_6746 [Saitoella complicata NRRL Y-17804]
MGEAAERKPVTTDPRFSVVHSDARFALPKRKDTKFAVDKRFKGMLNDKEFADGPSVDRYGRRVGKDKGKEEIKRYYRMEDEEEGEEGEDSEDDEDKEEDDEDEESDEEEVKKYDPARGEGIIDSSDSEEETDEEELAELGSDVEGRELADPEPDRESIPTGEETNRFAVVNLDWDHVRAVDLFATLSSFEPPGGKVRSVVVYPSEFGKERLAKEDMEGPPKDIFGGAESGSDDDDEEITEETIIKEDKGEDFDMDKLRKYQLERLRYYYAIVTCDSTITAKYIYDAIDGAEYENSANFFDLRFVPDDVTFEDDPRDEADHVPESYAPDDFVTDALQHSKVKLTWDEEDQARVQLRTKAFSQKDIEDMDFKAYLASDSEEEEEEDDEAQKEKYRALLLGVKKKSGADEDAAAEGDMEITFGAALDEKDEKDEEEEEVVEGEEEETTLEKYRRKERERKERRRAERKVNIKEDDDKEELGFDDPFFQDGGDKAAKQDKKKKDKKVSAEEAEMEAARKAELELLMMDEKEESAITGGKKPQHFDMKQVLKAEKAKKKKGKTAKKQLAKVDQEATQSDFQIDVKDPRFAALYESHHFAIDPTNPQFKKTEAMEKVLDERRKRHENGREEPPAKAGKKRKNEEGQGSGEAGKKAKKVAEKEESGSDLASLVRRIKAKSGQA